MANQKSNRFQILQTILKVFPFFILIINLLTGLSSYLGDRSTILCLFLAVWMVTWWVFEILPLGITALIPLFYLPVLGILDIKEVTPAYSNPVIFLFLGGFIIARALEKTNLDEKIALNILKKTGKSDSGIVAGFIIATAFLSMWISNTATTVMMVPIAMSVSDFLKSHLEKKELTHLPRFNTVLFLSIAWSANIGGIMTPIGTPPNVVFMGYLSDLYNISVDFSLWILATAPVAVTLLVVMFFMLKKIYPYAVKLPSGFSDFICKKLAQQGTLKEGQKITLWIFFLAAALWIFKSPIHYLFKNNFLNDTSVAIFCGLLLFLVPQRSQKMTPVLVLKDINKLPWDIVLLFGGGMALASSLKAVGVIQSTTDFFSALNFPSSFFLIFTLAGLALFLTEIMSNVALCVVALPLIMKLGEAQGISPMLIGMPAALCASFAFSMPISTPPNAIVFGTGYLKVSQMLRAGILLNILALLLTMSLGYFLIGLILVP